MLYKFLLYDIIKTQKKIPVSESSIIKKPSELVLLRVFPLSFVENV